MKKDIWIVVIILCSLGIASVIYKVWKDGKNGLLEKFASKNNTNFNNNASFHNNLINNVSFDYGRQPDQFSGSNGKFEVVVFPNNGQSSYVLRQSSLKTIKGDEPIYYRMDFLLKPASVYYFGCLYYSVKDLPLRNFIIFNNTQNVLLKTVQEPKYQYSKAGDFKYRYSLFKTPNHSDFVKTSIYLGYNFNNITSYNYFTDLGLWEIVNNNVIPIWENLRSYFNAFNIDSIDPGFSIVRDLSYHGFDFIGKVPDNNQKGNIDLTENSLSGPSAFKLQNSGVIDLTTNFSFLIHIKGSKIYQKQMIESFASLPSTSSSVQNTNPAKMTLNEFQELWNKAGCKSILKEENLAKWRTQDYKTVLKDIENLNNLTKNCNGTDAQNNLCFPGKCLKKDVTCDKSSLSYSKLKEPANTITTNSAEELKKEISKIDCFQLINFPGNQLFAVSILVPNKYGPIRIVAGGTIFESSVYQLNYLDLIFGVVYDGEKIRLFLNGELIMETNSPKIHFEDEKVIINPEGNFYGDLYSFAYYNKALQAQQIRNISNYFVRMKSVGEEITSIDSKLRSYVNTFIISDFSPEEESKYASAEKIISLKKTIDSINNINNIAPNKVIDKCKQIYGVKDSSTKNKPKKSSSNKLIDKLKSDSGSVKSDASSVKSDTSSVKSDASSVKSDTSSVKSDASSPKSTKSDSNKSDSGKSDSGKSDKRIKKSNTVEGDGVTCPDVRFEDDHYYIIIPPNTDLSKKLGYSGLRDYGTNIDTAKQIFQTNFPKCKVPSILDKNKYQGDLSNCPFIIINNENPCKKFDCKGTDWKKGTSNNSNCKKAIDTYCTKYADLDNACYCWREDNKNKPDCLQWRGKFENQDKCDFRKADFTKHPDAKNWIRKDKIPCWGCNLSESETAKNNKRPGSGGR